MNLSANSEKTCSAGEGLALKRRKVRKGTQSCWECKRRKIRCNFPTTNLICDGCKHRKTACISQEYPDEPVKLSDNYETDNRLDRLEVMVGQLIEKIGVDDQAEAPSNHGCSAIQAGEIGARPSPGVSPGPTLVHSSVPDIGTMAFVFPAYHEPQSQTKQNNFQLKPLQSEIDNPTRVSEPTEKSAIYSSICEQLIRLWPCETDLELILSIPVQVSGLFHIMKYAPHNCCLSEQTQHLRDIFQLPKHVSHPVLIARRLLILASYLQGLSPGSLVRLTCLTTDCHVLMSSAVEYTHSYVTSNDKLVNSIEGIECMLLESMYQNNAGNLVRAWNTTRRAILIAQMMGMHRSTALANATFLESETRQRIQPNDLWFRLVQADRYLSLMLGLPQGSLSKNFAESQRLEQCTPIERMQRLDCVAAGYILQQNEAGIYDIATTLRIDRLLQMSSASMPPQWWTVPFLPSALCADTEILERVLRTMDQITHYHLVTQLHLPYLLRSSTSREYNYSKLTAINASREILLLFVSFPGSNPITSFCRGVNYVVFIACMVLCIAHIDAHLQRLRKDSDHISRLSSLTHQRLRDRGAMELALACLERFARDKSDEIASQIASLLAHILSIEADSVLNGMYVTEIFPDRNNDELGCGGTLSQCGGKLQIHIPYHGTIAIQRWNSAESIWSTPLISARRFQPTPASKVSSPYSLLQTNTPSVPEWQNDQEQHLRQPAGQSSEDLFCNIPQPCQGQPHSKPSPPAEFDNGTFYVNGLRDTELPIISLQRTCSIELSAQSGSTDQFNSFL